MTTLTLFHPGRSVKVIAGFATGFERSGPAYTVPFVVSRMKEPMGFLQADPNTSQQIRDITELISYKEELEKVAEKYLEFGVGVLDRIANKEGSYMSLSSD